MKTKLFTVLLTCLLCVNMFATSVWSGGSDLITQGSGTESNPYLIESADQLAFIAEMVNAGVSVYSGQYFKLQTDIDLNSIEWTPIGIAGHVFQGNFDGNNHTINGLVVSIPNQYSGLFGSVKNGTFCNINLQGTFALDSIVGGVIAYGEDITITNCTVEVQISGANTVRQLTYLGGVLGKGLRVNIQDCTSHGSIAANATYITNCVVQNRQQYRKSILIEYRVGGIVGDLKYATILRCMNDAHITIESTSAVNQRYTSSAKDNDRYPGIDINNLSSLYIGGIVGSLIGVQEGTWDRIAHLINKGNISGIAHSNFTEIDSPTRMFGQTWNWTNSTNASVGGIAGYTHTYNTSDFTTYAKYTYQCLENEGNVNANGTSYFVPGWDYNHILENDEAHTNKYTRAAGIIAEHNDFTSSTWAFECVNKGNITSDGTSSGLGNGTRNGFSMKCTYCYNSGTIEGETVWGIADHSAINCYNVGTLVGTTVIGVSSYYSTNSYYLATCGATQGGVSKTDIQMKSASFPIMLNADSTVYYRDTKLINNGYPIFARQIVDTVSFDAESGICAIEKKVVQFKTQYGELPIASREGYEFEGWYTEDGTLVTDTTIVTIVTDHTLHAHWKAIQYTISGIAENGHIDGLGVYDNNSIVTLTAVADDHYHFVRWSDGVTTATRDVIVTKDTTFAALFDINSYTISFVNYNGVVLQTSDVEYGQIPAYNGATPTRSADAQYTYTFRGWDKEIVSVVGAETYTALYDSIVNKYTITFVDEDGTTTLQTSEVEYGQVPAYNGATPSKAATAQYTYAFAGWSPEVVAVTAAATYTATYSSTINKYTITFINSDGMTLQTSEVEYGQIPAYNGATPTKSATPQYSYTFAGWTPEIVAVTGNATYTAIYSRTINQYTISFIDEDGTILQTSKVQYGQMPTYNGETPTKFATAQYTYTFSGWTPNVEMVVGNAIYVATYSSIINKYTITFVDQNGTTLQTSEVEYGQVPAYNGATPSKEGTAQYTYTFAGWTPEVVAVTSDATYTATYSSTVNQYTITVSGENCTTTGEGTYDYGTEVTLTVTPDEGYRFIEWSDGVPEAIRQIIVIEDATYIAIVEDSIGTGWQKNNQSEQVQKIFDGTNYYILRGGKRYTMQGQEVK